MRRCTIHKRVASACTTPCAREGCGHECALHYSKGGGQSQHSPGTCYAAGCRCQDYQQKTTKGNEMPVGTVIRSPATCFCGEPMPWHMFGVVDNGSYSHVCANGHGWAWHSPTKARYTGRKSNPIAEHDKGGK